jgi:hypothetical protein
MNKGYIVLLIVLSALDSMQAAPPASSRAQGRGRSVANFRSGAQRTALRAPAVARQLNRTATPLDHVRRPGRSFAQPNITTRVQNKSALPRRSVSRAQLVRQLSPQRTFSTHTAQFRAFRTPERLTYQRNFLRNQFRGHDWAWWWRYRPNFFYSYFPYYFYDTYGYYPPIYYDYYDAYGYYPGAVNYTNELPIADYAMTQDVEPLLYTDNGQYAPESDQRSCMQQCLDTTSITLGHCLNQCGIACKNNI